MGLSWVQAPQKQAPQQTESQKPESQQQAPGACGGSGGEGGGRDELTGRPKKRFAMGSVPGQWEDAWEQEACE